MDDPSRPSLSHITEAGHPFAIPWSHEEKPLLTGFDSKLMAKPEDPWMLSCPFDLGGLKMTTIIPDTGGGTASYHDGMSTNSGSSSDHSSAALGITFIGL